MTEPAAPNADVWPLTGPTIGDPHYDPRAFTSLPESDWPDWAQGMNPDDIPVPPDPVFPDTPTTPQTTPTTEEQPLRDTTDPTQES